MASSAVSIVTVDSFSIGGCPYDIDAVSVGNERERKRERRQSPVVGHGRFLSRATVVRSERTRCAKRDKGEGDWGGWGRGGGGGGSRPHSGERRGKKKHRGLHSI